MTSDFLKSVKPAVFTGLCSYFFCYASNQTNAFEKALLATVLIGLRQFTEIKISHQYQGEYRNFLVCSARLLAIPCTLFAGRVFNFKGVDYLHIIGLAALGYQIKSCLESLYKMIIPPRPI